MYFSMKMFLQSRILCIYGLFCVLICSVVTLKCDKLITNDNTATEDHVFNEGVYRIKTSLEPKSEEIQELLDSLKDIGNVKLHKRSFTATLQPKHIKKVRTISSYLLYNNKLTNIVLVVV